MATPQTAQVQDVVFCRFTEYFRGWKALLKGQLTGSSAFVSQ
jgi:hypothetical protein